MGHSGSCFDLCHQVFCLFSSKSFKLYGLTFRSLIHFKVIFVHGVRKHSNFIVFCAVQFSQNHLLKRLSFSHCIFLPPLSKIKGLGLSLEFYLFPLLGISVFVPVQYCLYDCSFVV